MPSRIHGFKKIHLGLECLEVIYLTKTKKYILAAVGVLAAIALIPVIGLGIDLAKTAVCDSKPAGFYADAWNIKFPESAKETYSLSTGGRDSWSYSVYTVEPDDDAAFADYSEDPIDEHTLEKMTEILDRVQVPKEQRPNLEQTYQWAHIGENEVPVSLVSETVTNLPSEAFDSVEPYFDNLYVLYDAQTNTVYTLIAQT